MLLDPKIKLSEDFTLQLKDTQEIKCVVYGSKGNELTWRSSKPSVVSVDENGVVTGLAKGESVITVTNGNLTATCVVTVKELRVLELPMLLKRIEEEAFMGDTTIREVTLPKWCKFIGARAFKDCENLNLVRIPKALTDIADDAFEGCGEIEYEYY